jgi:hypothetical protein
MEKLKYLAASAASFGILFRVEGYPYASELLLLGFTGISVYCVIKAFKAFKS